MRGQVRQQRGGLHAQGAVAVEQVQHLKLGHRFVLATVAAAWHHAHSPDVHEHQHQDAADLGRMRFLVFTLAGQEHHIGAPPQGQLPHGNRHHHRTPCLRSIGR